jgi:dihydrofolate reductase
MRKLVVAEYVTLDGVMQDPGGVGELAQSGWNKRYWNDELAKFQYDGLVASDALLLGRVTYEGFAAAWPTMTGEGDFAVRMNAYPKYVASTTLRHPAWTNSHVLEGDVADAVPALGASTASRSRSETRRGPIAGGTRHVGTPGGAPSGRPSAPRRSAW